jgi:spore coat protein U-like protein
MRLSSLVRLGLAMAGLLLAPAAARAQGATGTLGVSVDVISACDFTVDDISFGTYTSGQGTDLDATGSIQYANCAGATLSLALDDGKNAENGDRGLAGSGAGVLRYDVFSDAAHTSSLGEGDHALEVAADQSGAGSISLYGRIFKDQAAVAGAYADSIAVTLGF